MGNTVVREDKGRPVPEGVTDNAAHRISQNYGAAPSGHHQQHPQYLHGDPSRFGHVGSNVSMGHSPPDSPNSAARSPLMFTPQVPMVPIPKVHELGLMSGYQQTGEMYNGPQLYEEPDRGMATMIVWSHGGNSVDIQGSWDSWSTSQKLQQYGKDFTIIKVLPSGVYQFRFIVDGEWRYAPELPVVYDGNCMNNVIDVQDYVPENLENVAGFEPPRSPESTYNDPFPSAEEYAREPPAVPPHLHLTLLNVPQNMDNSGTLPRPQHVILNHLYVEKGKTSRSVLVLGSTQRFRSKYVTTVLYKPLVK